MLEKELKEAINEKQQFREKFHKEEDNIRTLKNKHELEKKELNEEFD